MFENVLESIKGEYKISVKPLLERIKNRESAVYEDFCKAIVKSIENRVPLPLFNSLRFSLELVDLRNNEFNMIFQIVVLSAMEKLAEYKEVQADDKGRYLFSKTPDKQQVTYGISSLRLTLECIYAWAHYFPFNEKNETSAFYKAYANLRSKKIAFPSDFKYIQMQNIEMQTDKRFIEPTTIKVLNQVPAEVQLPANKRSVEQQQHKVFNSIPIEESVKNQAPVPSLGNIDKSVKTQTQNQDVRVLQAQAQETIQSYKMIYEQFLKSIERPYQSRAHFVRNLKHDEKEFRQISEALDQQINELMRQKQLEDNVSSMELLNTQAEITKIIKDIQQVENEAMSPEVFKQKYANTGERVTSTQLQQIPANQVVSQSQRNAQQPGFQLHPIDEVQNSEESTYSKQHYSQIQGRKYESTSVNYDFEQMRRDFEQHLNTLKRQHQEQLDKKEKECDQIRQKQEEAYNNYKYADQQLNESKRREQQLKEQLQKLSEERSVQSQEQLNSLQHQNRELKQMNHQLEKQVEDLKLELKREREQKVKKVVVSQISIEPLAGQSSQAQQSQPIYQLQQLLADQKQQSYEREKQLIHEAYDYKRQISVKEDKINDLQSLIRQLQLELKYHRDMIEFQNLQQQLSKEMIQKLNEQVQNFVPQVDQQIMQKNRKMFTQYGCVKWQLKVLQKQLSLEEGIEHSQNHQQNSQEKIDFHPDAQSQIHHEQNEVNLFEPQQRDTANFNFSPPAAERKVSEHHLMNTQPDPDLIAPIERPFYQGFDNVIKLKEQPDPVEEARASALGISKLNFDTSHFFPYTSAQEYYSSKIKKPHKGEPCKFRSLQSIVTKENCLNLKKIHFYRNLALHNTIFKDQEDLIVGIQIHTICDNQSIAQHYALYYQTNCSDLMLKAELIRNSSRVQDMVLAKPQKLEQVLEKKKQVRQEIQVVFPQGDVGPQTMITIRYKNSARTLLLPDPYWSLLEFERMEVVAFKRKMIHPQLIRIRTDEFPYNQAQIPKQGDLKQMSEALMILNPDKMEEYEMGIDEIKYGASIKILALGLKALIKFEISPSKTMLVQIGYEQNQKKFSRVFQHLLWVVQFTLQRDL